MTEPVKVSPEPSTSTSSSKPSTSTASSEAPNRYIHACIIDTSNTMHVWYALFADSATAVLVELL